MYGYFRSESEKGSLFHKHPYAEYPKGTQYRRSNIKTCILAGSIMTCSQITNMITTFNILRLKGITVVSNSFLHRYLISRYCVTVLANI